MNNEQLTIRAQTLIKARLSQSPMYTEIINQSKSFMDSLSSSEIKQIQKGRSSQLFKNLQTCKNNSFIPAQKCIANILQSKCEDKLRNMSKCLISNGNNNIKCAELGEVYVECLRNVTKKFYLSTVISF